MTGVAATERAALAATLAATDPAAPTLCAGWDAYDLVAHLVSRESRPDITIAAVIPGLIGHAESHRLETRRRPYPELVEAFRVGPQGLSAFRVPGVDRWGNTLEHVVHHEDVRRAQPRWTPRAMPVEADTEIWRRTSQLARLIMRRAPVGVALLPEGGSPVEVHKGAPQVVVSGRPVELALWIHGRNEAAQVTFQGDSTAMGRLRAFRSAV